MPVVLKGAVVGFSETEVARCKPQVAYGEGIAEMNGEFQDAQDMTMFVGL